MDWEMDLCFELGSSSQEEDSQYAKIRSKNLDILFKRNQATAAVRKEENAKILTTSSMNCDEARYYFHHQMKILLCDQVEPFYEKSWDLSVDRSSCDK